MAGQTASAGDWDCRENLMESAEPGPPRPLRPAAGPGPGTCSPGPGLGTGAPGPALWLPGAGLGVEGGCVPSRTEKQPLWGARLHRALGHPPPPGGMGTGRMRLFGALIFQMEKTQESCTVFFLSRLLFYTEQKKAKSMRAVSADRPRERPRLATRCNCSVGFCLAFVLEASPA